MLIALTGMPGSGKTTVGRILADALGCPFMDLDELIEKKAGKPIPQIFAEDGEAAFREWEGKQLKQTVSKYAGADAVLALGGGSVCLPGAAQLLQDKTLCIYLRASVDTLAARLQGASGRPLLSGTAPSQLEALTATLATLLAAREALYDQAAHVTLDTDGVTPEAIADEIIISVL